MENKQKMAFMAMMLITMMFFSGLNLFGSPPNVYDKASLFSASELEALDKKAADSSEKLMIEFVILTISDNQDKTVEDYAQDFYSQNELGYGAGKNALLMLFDMDSEQLYVSPFSNDGTDYNNQEFKFKYDELIAKFGSDDFYYAAATAYLDTIESYINENNIQIVTNTVSQNNTDDNATMGIYLFAAIMLGGMVVWLMVPKMDNTYAKEVKTSLEVSTYLENNALDIVDRQDRHIKTQMASSR